MVSVLLLALVAVGCRTESKPLKADGKTVYESVNHERWRLTKVAGSVRTTNLTAEVACKIYRLPVEAIEGLASQDPALLLELPRTVMRVLAVRLTDANQEIEGLRA